MKQVLGVLFLSLTLSHVAFADTNIPWTKEGCESVQGTWVVAKSATDSGCDTAHCNGMTFCRSNNHMNWWSALVWCKSIGHKHASFAHLCPGIPTEMGLPKGACANISGRDDAYFVWTDLPWGTTDILTVSPRYGCTTYGGGCGGVAGRTYHDGNNGYAICEE